MREIASSRTTLQDNIAERKMCGIHLQRRRGLCVKPTPRTNTVSSASTKWDGFPTRDESFIPGQSVDSSVLMRFEIRDVRDIFACQSRESISVERVSAVYICVCTSETTYLPRSGRPGSKACCSLSLFVLFFLSRSLADIR